MPNVIRFVEGVNIDGQTFYQNEEREWTKKEELYIPEEEKWSWLYTFKAYDKLFKVTDDYVIETNIYSNTGTQGESYEKKYWDEHTTDASEEILGKEDYVEAADRFLGVDIKPHDRSDKSDYADQDLVPEEYWRIKNSEDEED